MSRKISVRVKAAPAAPAVPEVPVREEWIRLDSFLKLVSAVGTGGEAKLRVQGGEILVNGEVCLQRGRKLRAGDVVSMGRGVWCVGKAAEEL